MKTTSRLIATFVFASLIAACNPDVLDASYASRAEAEADEAIGRGWVPEWIPVNARDIREVHNIDTNEGALVFRLPSGSKWRPPSVCRPAQGGEFAEPRFNREWIPELDAKATYFSCPAEPDAGTPLVEAVAVLQDGERVFYWRAFAR